MIQHNFEQPGVRKSVPLYQPPRAQEAVPQKHMVENPHQQPAVSQTRHAITEFTPERRFSDNNERSCSGRVQEANGLSKEEQTL